MTVTQYQTVIIAVPLFPDWTTVNAVLDRTSFSDHMMLCHLKMKCFFDRQSYMSAATTVQPRRQVDLDHTKSLTTALSPVN